MIIKQEKDDLGKEQAPQSVQTPSKTMKRATYHISVAPHMEYISKGSLSTTRKKYNRTTHLARNLWDANPQLAVS